MKQAFPEMNIERAKAKIRSEMSGGLERISPVERADASARIRASLISQRIWKEAQSLLLFAPIRNEVDIWPLAADAEREGKTLALPRSVEGGPSYVAAVVERISAPLHKGRFGIKEPASDAPVIPLKQLDLVLVPAVAFDPYGARLGRGGGYYDRLLSGVPGAKCGVAFDAQIVERIPAEPHDIPMDYIVTPTRLIRCGGIRDFE